MYSTETFKAIYAGRHDGKIAAHWLHGMAAIILRMCVFAAKNDKLHATRARSCILGTARANVQFHARIRQISNFRQRKTKRAIVCVCGVARREH